MVRKMAGVDKTKNNSGVSPFFSGASICFLQIQAKKTMNQTKIKLYISGAMATGRLYLSTPGNMANRFRTK
jgi:hypothetical protein